MDASAKADRLSTAPSREEIAEAIRGLPPTGYSAVLFGSRATGRAGPRSDWDIGVLGPAPAPGSLLERIREALDSLRTLHRFEVVDLASVPDDFRQHALRDAARIA